jgi:hypothetical protein
MKTLKIILFSIIFAQNSFAQGDQISVFLEKVELSGFKNKTFFNKAVYSQDVLDKLRIKEYDAEKQYFMNIEKQDFN